MTSYQNIKRIDLQTIYLQVCQDWQKKILDLALWQSGETISVPEDLILEAYNSADDKQKKMLKNFFDVQKIIELDIFNVKSFTELCKIKNIEELTEKDFKHYPNPSKMLVLWQIDIIESIYNNGWKPDFTDSDQEKWYPSYIFKKGSLQFYCSCYYHHRWSGEIGLYKSKKISDFVGNTFMDIYLKFLNRL